MRGERDACRELSGWFRNDRSGLEQALRIPGYWRAKQFYARIEAAYRLRAAYRAVERFPSQRARYPHRLQSPVVVTLTSYPPRYPTLALTLKSLLDQTVIADRIVLWIAYGDYAQLPEEVHALTGHGLEIRQCDDLRSFNKLVPALREFPDAVLVTADDDLYYPPDWLAVLLSAHDPDSPAIVAVRAHLALVDQEGLLRPYNSWIMATHEVDDVPPFGLLFPTGCGGVLYPPRIFPDLVLDETVFMTLCPQADDLWFFWVAEHAGIHHRRVAAEFPMISWKSSQEIGLMATNVHGDGNDRQIRALEQNLGRIGKANPKCEKIQ